MSKTNPYDGITYIDNETYTAIVDMQERTQKAYEQGKADAIEKMKALIYQFDDYCEKRECKYCWMNVSDDYSCLKQWINSKFEELRGQEK